MARIQNDVSSTEKLVISKKLQMCLPFNPAIPLSQPWRYKLQEIQNNTAEGYSMKYYLSYHNNWKQFKHLRSDRLTNYRTSIKCIDSNQSQENTEETSLYCHDVTSRICYVKKARHKTCYPFHKKGRDTRMRVFMYLPNLQNKSWKIN